MELMDILKIKNLIKKAMDDEFVISVNRIQIELLCGFRKATKIKAYLISNKITNERGEILISFDDLKKL